ncbi:hypothetical protein J4447_03515 [Candidatus Pacearchaeota archaeon]|nr:hypothetical protein [Candidatus Pacearchaeota archaeon]
MNKQLNRALTSLSLVGGLVGCGKENAASIQTRVDQRGGSTEHLVIDGVNTDGVNKLSYRREGK